MTAKFFIYRSVLAFATLLAPAAAHATPFRPTAEPVTVVALAAEGADLSVVLMLTDEAPSKLTVTVETATGAPVGSATLSPAVPGRTTVRLIGAVEGFSAHGFDYRIRLRDASGAEVAVPAPFTVGMSCASEVCRFVPELGVETGAAVWLEDRLADALRSGAAASPDLLALVVADDSSLLGAARNLAARLAEGADGSCHCRWIYSTTPSTCSDPSGILSINDRGVPRLGFSVHQAWTTGLRLETACWTARLDGGEKIRLAFGDHEKGVSWPQVRLAPCGSCPGRAVAHATFLGGATAVAEGVPGEVRTRASWSYSVTADGNVVLADSDRREAASPNGFDLSESTRDWTGTAGLVEWQSELVAELEAPRMIDHGVAKAQIAYDVRWTAEAACASPAVVSVGRDGWLSRLDPVSTDVDPNQISVVVGECRPPR